MERLRYEFLAAPDGASMREAVEEFIAADPMLSVASDPWQGPAGPVAGDLYACILLVSDDLTPTILERVNALHEARFPIVAVVNSCTTYSFHAAPSRAISTRNAVGLDTPEKVVSALLHHGGLRHHGRGGKAFISYARVDGSELAHLLVHEFDQAGFHAVLDIREMPGGVHVQESIQSYIRESHIVILVDSLGASKSPWVDIEIDMARAYHVAVVAVTPQSDSFRHHFGVPHVPWGHDDPNSLAVRVVDEARRILARQSAFEERTQRALDCLCRARGWRFETKAVPWMVEYKHVPSSIVRCRPEEPSIQLVQDFCEDVEARKARGLLVAGTRPYDAKSSRGYAKLGGDHVRVTPLPRVASSLAISGEPLTLNGRRILLSAALPDDDQCALANVTLGPFVIVLVQTVVSLGGVVVFGGHPSITPSIHRAISGIAVDGGGAVELHHARSWQPSAEADDQCVFKAVTFHGDGKDPVEDIKALRSGMIRAGLAAGVFVGGKTKQAIGGRPGIHDEFERFRTACPTAPALVLHLAGGAALDLRSENVDERIGRQLHRTTDPDLATAFIIGCLTD